MNINVDAHNIEMIEESIVNKNEYKVNIINFTFSEEYTDDLVKNALFTRNDKTYKMVIENNQCDIPPEILKEKGQYIIGVYAYKSTGETLNLRYSPQPIRAIIEEGSYQENAENSEPITPSELEQYEQALHTALTNFTTQINAKIDEMTALENTINQNEETRESNETTRIENETSREKYITNLKADVEAGKFNGKDATINGVNTLNVVAGENITMSQEENTLTINATKQTDNNYTTDEKNKLAGLNNYDDTELREEIAKKQDTLISGTNIKTINNESILGSGNIEVKGGGGSDIGLEIQNGIIVCNYEGGE